MAGDGSRTIAQVASIVARVRPRARTVATGGLALAVATPLALAAAFGSGHAPRLLAQTPGTAWVVSSGQGLVTLLDGASEDVVVGVPVPGAGHALGVAQARGGAYLVDDDAGTVSRLDAATYAASTPVALGTPGGGLTVLQNDPVPGGRHVVHVLDPGARTATRVDPRTLAVHDEVTLTARPRPGQAVVDHAGDLWALDAATGTITRVGVDEPRTVRRTDAATATARLVLVRGAPVLVDPARGAVHRVGTDARPGAALCLDTRPADDVEVLGSAARDEVYVAVAQARSLLVTSTTGDGCGRAIALDGPDDDPQYAALAQSGRYVFVPDSGSGTVAVVDTAAGRVLDHVALTDPGHRLELRAQDGFVFFNDLDGHTAGVLTLRGGRWAATALDKYDPTTGEGAAVVLPEDQRPPLQAPAGDAPGDAPTDDAAAPDGPAAPGPRPTVPPGGPGPRAPGDPGSGGPGTGGPGTGPGPSAPPTSPPPAGPSPTPPAAALTVTLGTDPPSPGQPEYQPLTSATVVASVSGAGPDATWAWDVTSAGSAPPTFTPPGPGQPLVLDSVGDGDVTVRLTVTDGDRSGTAELLLWVKYECHITVNGSGSGDDHVVDLRASTSGTFTVEAHECRGPQTAGLTLPDWLSGPTQVDLADSGAPSTVEVSLVGDPPGDGPQSGAFLTFTAHGEYPLAVLTDVGPEVTSAEACQVPMNYTDGGGVARTRWITRVIVEVRDATVGGPDRHVVTGGDGSTVPAVDTSGTDRTYERSSDVDQEATAPAPARPPATVTVTDGFGKTTGPVAVFFHPSTPSPCFGGG